MRGGAVERVLLTTDTVGGVWDFSLGLAGGLRRRHAAAVTLLALGELSAAQQQAAAHAGVELVVEPLRLEWMHGSDADVRRTGALVAALADACRADVIGANQFAAACAPTRVPVVLTLHSDVLSWWRWTLGQAAPAEWQGYARLVAAALARAERVVAVSRFLADQVAAEYDCQRPIEVIHNGWPAPAAVRPMNQREPMTLLAGRVWDAAKNLELAGAALRLGPLPGEVVLAGQQTHPETGGPAAVPPGIRPLGFLEGPALAGWLERARVYLSPARYDPFGLLPLQAALHGCALLLSDIPSYRELWDGVAAFFAPDSAADLRQAWSSLLEDEARCAALAARARQRAVERYSPATMVDAYWRTYLAVCSSAPAPVVA